MLLLLICNVEDLSAYIQLLVSTFGQTYRSLTRILNALKNTKLDFFSFLFILHQEFQVKNITNKSYKSHKRFIEH